MPWDNVGGGEKKRDTRCSRGCIRSSECYVGGYELVSIGARSLVLAAAASGVHTFPVIHFETGSAVERRSSPGVDAFHTSRSFFTRDQKVLSVQNTPILSYSQQPSIKPVGCVWSWVFSITIYHPRCDIVNRM